jgi:hypothetical protein
MDKGIFHVIQGGSVNARITLIALVSTTLALFLSVYGLSELRQILQHMDLLLCDLRRSQGQRRMEEVASSFTVTVLRTPETPVPVASSPMAPTRERTENT